MSTEYDERLPDYWRLSNGEYIVKLKQHEGLEGETDLKITMPADLGSVILSNKRIINNFLREVYGLKNNNVYYTDTDSLYIEKKNWDVLNKAELVGENLCQGKNDLKNGGIFYGLFLAPKIKYCLTIDEYGIIEEHKTFKGFTESQRLLDRNQYSEMLKGNKMHAKLPISWKKGCASGIVIPKQARYCTDCKKDSICTGCDKKMNQIKEIAPNLNELKRQPANSFGHMPLWCVNYLNENQQRF